MANDTEYGVGPMMSALEADRQFQALPTDERAAVIRAQVDMEIEIAEFVKKCFG